MFLTSIIRKQHQKETDNIFNELADKKQEIKKKMNNLLNINDQLADIVKETQIISSEFIKKFEKSYRQERRA